MASAQRTATWVIPRAITMTDSDPPECASGRGADLRNAICYHLICFLMRPGSPSHGENRGSSPLGSAKYFNVLANKATATVHLPSSFKHQERARLGDYGGCRMAFRAAPSGVAQIGGTEYGG